MSNNPVASIEMLPVELVHQIFDDLDLETILYSIRPLSRLFRSIVNSYNRYIFNFNFTSKSQFSLLCRLIPPENVISITLSNDERTFNQIGLFLSVVHLQQLTRLRSLTLIDINQFQLNFILKRINLNLLSSFSLNIRKCYDQLIELTTTLFSSMITKTNLQKLELNTFHKIPHISWPINSLTEYFLSNNRINVVDLCKILECSPYLHLLIINEIPKGIITNLTSICFRQLRSLTIQNVCVTIDELESFLLLTSSLIYLKLIGGKQMINGKRWEQFIQINLPQLDKFTFYFSEFKSNKQTLTDLKLILNSFETPFWIEYKKWFVVCEYEHIALQLHMISLYSIPICTSHINYTSTSKKISLATYPMIINNDLTTMDNIKSITFTLNKSIINDIQQKRVTTHHSLFRKVTEIDLQFCDDWPLVSLQSLSIFIDISRIVHIKLSSNYLNEYNQKLLIDMKMFLEEAHNLFSLFIHSSFYRHKSNLTIEDIHSILPHHIKYLQIPIDDFNQINIIRKRCQHLSTIQFDIEDVQLCEQVVNWFHHNIIHTACQQSNHIVTVCFDNKSTQTYTQHKRIKFK